MGGDLKTERILLTVRSPVSELELFSSTGALLPHCCGVCPFRRHSPPTVWRPPVGSTHHATPHGGEEEGRRYYHFDRHDNSTTTPQDEATPGQEPANGNEDITIEDIAEGQHEVDLLDLGISAEDITAMRKG